MHTQNIAILLFIAWMGLSANLVHANVYYVNSAGDDPLATADEMDGKISLREAVMAASTNQPFGDAAAGDPNSYDIIHLRPTGKGSVVTIKLKQELVIRGTMRITDSRITLGGNRVEISGQNRCRIFNVTTGATLTLENINLTNGNANYGGAIYVRSAHMSAENVEFRDNIAFDGGAVAFIKSSGTLDSCTLMDNFALNGGGAIVADLGEFVFMDNCTLTGNLAISQGGALLLRRGHRPVPTTVAATNCTVVDNSVGLGEGGGFQATGSTTSDNLFLFNCIVAGNTKQNTNGDAIPDDIDARPLLAFSNLIGLASSNTTIIDGQNGNFVGVPQQPLDPGLGNLNYYGGRTRGFRPLANSLARNNGDNEFVDGTGTLMRVVSEDQRGVNRIRGGIVDMGSIER